MKNPVRRDFVFFYTLFLNFADVVFCPQKIFQKISFLIAGVVFLPVPDQIKAGM